MDLSFSEWATIAGGFSGFLSFAYVLIEKLTSGPKIISKVKSAELYENEPTDMDKWYSYDFYVEIEIGNAGNKPVSLIKPELNVEDSKLNFNLNFPSTELHGQGSSSLLLVPGFADSYNMHYRHRCEKPLKKTVFESVLKFKQITGKSIGHTLKIVRVK